MTAHWHMLPIVIQKLISWQKQQVIAPMESVSISELENVTCTDDGADNDDEHVTHDQALGILEQEPVQEQHIN